MAIQTQVSRFIAIAIAVVVPLYGFSAEIYTCVDQKGHKRIQMTRCAAKDRTIGREETKTPSNPNLAPTSKPPTVLPPTTAAPAIAASPKQTGDTNELLEEFQRAQANAVGAPNGVEVLSSAICRLYKQYSEPDQRQLLLTQAQSLGRGVANGSQLVAAAMGQCSIASGQDHNGAATMPLNSR